jgi:hypothetical protein
MLSEIRTGIITSADGGVNPGRADKQGCLVITGGHGTYAEASARQNLFAAQAINTAPVIYTTAAGTGGPLIWNGSTSKNVNILLASISISVVSTVAGSVGLTGATGQVSAPGSTTAIDSVTNLYLGGASPAATAYRVGTPTNAGTFFIPLFEISTGALTVAFEAVNTVDLKGILTVPPGSWCALAGSATLSTLQARMSLVWEEIPI